MKPSISISTYKPRFAPITLQSDSLGSFENNCAMAKEAGYRGVDLFIDKKTGEEIDKIGGILERYDLKVAMLICIYLAESGVNLSYPDRKRREEACDIYIREMSLAHRLHAATMPIGLIRGGYVEGDSPEAYEARLADSCIRLAEGAERNGIRLCIEPVNRYEIDTLNSVDQAVDFIEHYSLDSICLVPDLFHMNIEDRDICSALERAGSRIAHMHVSDSNRRAPGMGHLDYEKILSTLHRIGYEGYLTLETLNFGETEKTVMQGARYLNQILGKIG